MLSLVQQDKNTLPAKVNLLDVLNPNNKIYLLEKFVQWYFLETHLAHRKLYHDKKDHRFLLALIILKSIFDKSNSELLVEWLENPYWQYLSGERVFQWQCRFKEDDLLIFAEEIGNDSLDFISEYIVIIEKNFELNLNPNDYKSKNDSNNSH
jgi:hypothetical protein